MSFWKFEDYKLQFDQTLLSNYHASSSDVYTSCFSKNRREMDACQIYKKTTYVFSHFLSFLFLLLPLDLLTCDREGMHVTPMEQVLSIFIVYNFTN